MGNCVRVHKDQNSAFKFRFSNAANVPSEINNVVDWEKEIGRLCSNHRSSTLNHVPNSPELSKDEDMFFDSHPWLDSDNEDFFSINGDNTRSYRNSPKSEAASPKDEKKQLIELFRESFNGDQGRSTSHFQLQHIVMESNNKSISIDRSKSVKGKSAQFSPCCIPNLARSLSLGVKKSRLSPYRGGQGQVDP